MKKFRRSPVAIACYVIAALLAVYFLAVIFSTLSTINEYYAQYDMRAGFGETFGYLMQNGMSIFVNALLVFMAGFILETVRKLNPSNWMTDEEIAEAREAKQLAREEKQAAKGEAAKIKAGVITAEEAESANAEKSVEAVFVTPEEENSDAEADAETDADAEAAPEEPEEPASEETAAETEETAAEDENADEVAEEKEAAEESAEEQAE